MSDPENTSEIRLVCCFGFNGPLRQSFSLYRAVSQREGERTEKRSTKAKMSKQPLIGPTLKEIISQTD